MKMLRNFFLAVAFFTPSQVLADIGFRDLVPGADFSVVAQNCVDNILGAQCYGLKDTSFSVVAVPVETGEQQCEWVGGPRQGGSGGLAPSAKAVAFHRGLQCNGLDALKEDRDNFIYFEPVDTLSHTDTWTMSDQRICSLASECLKVAEKYLIGDVVVRLGPLPPMNLANLIIGQNPYTDLRTSMDAKYKLDWEFTERERQLFNEGSLSDLYVSYEGGQAMINLQRIGLDIHLIVEYFTKDRGAEVSNARKPNGVSASDF